MDRIKNIGNHSIDLERIRTIKHILYRDLKQSKALIIEYNARVEYLKKPSDNEFEKIEIVDTIEIKFLDFETAQLNYIALQRDWNNYLKSKTQ